MLPKERMIAALEFTKPDRVPIGETGIDYTITEEALGHPTLYRGKWKEYQALWQGRRDEYVESCKRDLVALAHKFVEIYESFRCDLTHDHHITGFRGNFTGYA